MISQNCTEPLDDVDVIQGIDDVARCTTEYITSLDVIEASLSQGSSGASKAAAFLWTSLIVWVETEFQFV